MSQGPGGNPLDANAQMSALPPTTAGQNIRPAPPPPRLVRPEPPRRTRAAGHGATDTGAAARHHYSAGASSGCRRAAGDEGIYDREEIKRTFQQGILNKQYEHRLKQAIRNIKRRWKRPGRILRPATGPNSKRSKVSTLTIPRPA